MNATFPALSSPRYTRAGSSVVSPASCSCLPVAVQYLFELLLSPRFDEVAAERLDGSVARHEKSLIRSHNI